MTAFKLFVFMLLGGAFIVYSLCAPLPSNAGGGGQLSLNVNWAGNQNDNEFTTNVTITSTERIELSYTIASSSSNEAFYIPLEAPVRYGYAWKSTDFEVYPGTRSVSLASTEKFLSTEWYGTCKPGPELNWKISDGQVLLTIRNNSTVAMDYIAAPPGKEYGDIPAKTEVNLSFPLDSTRDIGIGIYEGPKTSRGCGRIIWKTIASPTTLPAPHVQYLNPLHNFSMGGTTYTSTQSATLAINGIGDKFDLSLYSVAEARTIFTRTFTGPSFYDKTMCLFGNIPDGCNGWPMDLANGEYEFRAIAWQGGSYNSNFRRITIAIDRTFSCSPVTFTEVAVSGVTTVTVSGAWWLSVRADPMWDAVSFDETKKLIFLQFKAPTGTIYIREASYEGAKLCQTYVFGKPAPVPTVNPYPYTKPKTASNRTFVPWAQR